MKDRNVYALRRGAEIANKIVVVLTVCVGIALLVSIAVNVIM